MNSSIFQISVGCVLLSISSFHSKATTNKQTKSQSTYIMNYYIEEYICKYIKIEKHLLNNYLLWNDWRTTWLYLISLYFNELQPPFISFFTNYLPTLVCSLHLIFVHCLSQAHKTIPWIYSCQINRQIHGNCMLTPYVEPNCRASKTIVFWIVWVFSG